MTVFNHTKKVLAKVLKDTLSTLQLEVLSHCVFIRLCSFKLFRSMQHGLAD